MAEKTNNDIFADMLNATPDPKLFAALLLMLAKPSGQDAKNIREKREIITGNLLSLVNESRFD